MQVVADGRTQQVEVQAGSTAGQAFEAAGLQASNLDKSDPPAYTVLSDGDEIQLTRVREEFITEEVNIPFEGQIARNESLPEGETRLVQPGVSGLQELTYRILLEDEEEVSRTVVKTVVIREAVPEIVMVGAQSAYAPLVIPGVLAYLSGGNAWLMEGTTADRRALVTSGDLDGRIFSISPDGRWLLFSRKSDKPVDVEINSLWAISLSRENAKPFSLDVKNVVHSAIWTPSSANVAYTTVEPRSTAPGWQANNDIYKVVIGNGWAGTPQRVLEANSGGVYGWWGMELHYSPEGILSYARADQIGLVDQQEGELKPLLEITPLQTHSDWAWVPGMAWGADSQIHLRGDARPAAQPGQRRGVALLRPDRRLYGQQSYHAHCPADRHVCVPIRVCFASQRGGKVLPGGFPAGHLPRAEREQPLPRDRHGPRWVEPARHLPPVRCAWP